MGEDRLQGRRRQGLLPLSDHGLHWLVLRKEVAAGVRNRLARHQGHLEGNGQQLPGQRCAAGMRVTDEWQALTDDQLAEVVAPGSARPRCAGRGDAPTEGRNRKVERQQRQSRTPNVAVYHRGCFPDTCSSDSCSCGKNKQCLPLAAADISRHRRIVLYNFRCHGGLAKGLLAGQDLYIEKDRPKLTFIE